MVHYHQKKQIEMVIEMFIEDHNAMVNFTKFIQVSVSDKFIVTQKKAELIQILRTLIVENVTPTQLLS